MDLNRLQPVVWTYSVLVLVSTVALFRDPHWRVGGVAWNLLFQLLAPQISFVLLLALVWLYTRKMARRSWIVPNLVFHTAYVVFWIVAVFPGLMGV